MKRIIGYIIVVMLLFSVGKLWAANDGYKDHKVQAAVQSMQEVQKKLPATNVGNKICPVSGEEIGKMGKGTQYEYNGNIYNFCCSGCLKDFNKNPEYYVKKVEETMKVKEERQGCGCQHKGGQSCSG